MSAQQRIARAVIGWVVGAARRRRALARRTTIILLFAGAVLAAGRTAMPMLLNSADNPGWYSYLTTKRLLATFETVPVHDGRTIAAWQELWQRDQDGDLSAAVRTRLIDLCLQAQARGPGGMVGGEVEFLAGHYVRGRLNAAQQQTFLRQLVDLRLRVRPRVAAGDPVPFEVTSRANLLDNLQLRLRDATIVSGERVLSAWPQLLSTTQAFDSLRGEFSCPERGSYPVVLHATAQVRAPGVGTDGQAGYQVCAEWPVELTSRFETTAPAAAEFPLESDPAMGPQLAQRVRPMHVEFRNYRTDWRQSCIDGQLAAGFDVDTLPVDVAFEVTARIGDREFPLEILSRRAGQDRTHCEVGCRYSGPLPRSMDLVLRGSPRAARRTIDLAGAWAGELTCQNVRVWPLDPEQRDDIDYD